MNYELCMMNDMRFKISYSKLQLPIAYCLLPIANWPCGLSSLFVILRHQFLP